MANEDYISRQAVMDCFKKWQPWMATRLHSFEEELKSLPSVQPKTGWVSASEKLPEEGKTVLVWYEYFRYGDYNCMWQTYGIGWQYGGHFSIDNGGASQQRVIAWCELPEGCKESEG